MNNQSQARAVQPGISIIEEPTYRLIKDVYQNDKIIGKIYEINVTFVNNGLINSEEIMINLTDEEHFYLSRKIILTPGETTVLFNWSTLLIKNQKIIISYHPSNQDIDWDKYNSGSKAFTLFMIDEENVKATSTPGFETVLLLVSLLIFIFILKKSKKN